MTPGGELRLRLTLQDGRVAAVDVASSRFELPARFTVGRPADEVAQIVPRLFSVCAHAQGAAAIAALDAARGRDPGADALRQRTADVRREAICELTTRLLLDWPRIMGAQPQAAPVAELRNAPPDRLLDVGRAIAQQTLFGMAPSTWLALEPDALDAWQQRAATLPARLLAQFGRAAPDLGCSAVPGLPPADDALMHELGLRLRQASFARTPDWQGAAAETGPLVRHAQQPLLRAYVAQHGNSAAARMLARLVEVAVLLADTDPTPALTHQHTLQAGVGVGAAETARGLLVHSAVLDGDRVVGYRILAPTEWNFHPDGALAAGLRQRVFATPDAARLAAGWLVQALDPCVACRIDVQVSEAADA